MNPGLGKGFVRFGTLAHGILTTIHVEGPQSNNSLCQTFPDTKAVAANIQRLIRYGFLYVIGSDRPEVGRSYRIYGLEPPKNKKNFVRKMKSKERTSKYRERKALRQSTSVFNFRGSIQL